MRLKGSLLKEYIITDYNMCFLFDCLLLAMARSPVRFLSFASCVLTRPRTLHPPRATLRPPRAAPRAPRERTANTAPRGWTGGAVRSRRQERAANDGVPGEVQNVLSSLFGRFGRCPPCRDW